MAAFSVSRSTPSRRSQLKINMPVTQQEETFSDSANILSTLLIVWTMQPWRELAAEAQVAIGDPVARYICTGRHDGIGWVQLVMKMLRSQRDGLVGRHVLRVATDFNALAAQFWQRSGA